jgi:hypothetical protein
MFETETNRRSSDTTKLFVAMFQKVSGTEKKITAGGTIVRRLRSFAARINLTAKYIIIANVATQQH